MENNQNRQPSQQIIEPSITSRHVYLPRVFLVLVVALFSAAVFGLLGYTLGLSHGTNVNNYPLKNKINYTTHTIPSPTITSLKNPHDFVVHGAAMLPNFHEEQVWLFKPYTSTDQPKRFDVVMVYIPKYSSTIAKRIIGLPGEKVKVSSGHVYINDQQLDESAYLDLQDVTVDGKSVSYTEINQSNNNPYMLENQEKIIPDNSYFVLGDYREDSVDSRDWGTISRDTIIGKLTEQITPITMPSNPNQCSCLDKVNNFCLPVKACQ